MSAFDDLLAAARAKGYQDGVAATRGALEQALADLHQQEIVHALRETMSQAEQYLAEQEQQQGQQP